MQVWRKGATGALGDWAVDMALVLQTSLGNAGALPTSHNRKKVYSLKDSGERNGRASN
jgi:hypothetical protein